MRLLVTGGAGLLGAAVAGRMLGAGHAVMAADAFGPEGDGRAVRGGRAAALKERGAEIRRLDLCEDAAIRDLLDEFHPDVLVHAARLPPDVSVEPLLAAAKSAGVTYLVHVSDADLYGPPAAPGVRAREDEALDPGNDPRLLARAWDEQAVRACGIPATLFRCFELVSAEMPAGRLAADVADAVLAGREVPLPDHDGRDFLDVTDAARAVQLALVRRLEGHTVNLGSGVPVSIRGLAEEIGRAARKAPLFGPAPPPARVARTADPSLAWELLGFGPEVPLSRIALALAGRGRGRGAGAAAASASPSAPGEPSRSATPAAPAPEVSRREMFGLFRRPFAKK